MRFPTVIAAATALALTIGFGLPARAALTTPDATTADDFAAKSKKTGFPCVHR